jgi:hypothetical protein
MQTNRSQACRVKPACQPPKRSRVGPWQGKAHRHRPPSTGTAHLANQCLAPRGHQDLRKPPGRRRANSLHSASAKEPVLAAFSKRQGGSKKRARGKAGPLTEAGKNQFECPSAITLARQTWERMPAQGLARHNAPPPASTLATPTCACLVRQHVHAWCAWDHELVHAHAMQACSRLARLGRRARAAHARAWAGEASHTASHMVSTTACGRRSVPHYVLA